MAKKQSFVISVDCAIEHNNKFLMIKRPNGKHAGGLLSFAGGALEVKDGDSEDACIQAAQREVFEELGLDLTDKLTYVTSSYFVDSKVLVPVINVTFYCKIKSTTLNINASTREVPEYYWLSYEDIINHDLCPEWIVRYMNKIKEMHHL